jgi:hypothetical protein
MAPRKRKADRKDWPDNLHPNGRYFRYIHPVTKDVTSLNCSFEQARQAAEIANAAIEQERQKEQSDLSRLLTRMINPEAGADYPFSQVLAYYESERIGGIVNKKTKKTLGSVLNIISRAPFSDRKFREIAVLDIDPWLQAQAPSNYGRIRRELVQIWKLAIRKGWQHHTAGNPAEHTESKPQPKRQRQRLPLEHYHLIREKASHRLAFAMRIMLHTTLRPIDVAGLLKANFDPGKRSLRAMIHKSRRDEDAATAKYLEIELSQSEVSFIQEGMKTGIASPLIVHKSTRSKKKLAADAIHWSQCTVDILSREFSKIRDDLGLYDEIENKKQRPSLYEIRALAGFLHEKAKGKDATTALMAHTDGDTTDIYLADHEPEFTRVMACLDI